MVGGWVHMGRVNQWIEYILDAVFPRSCVSCSREGTLLCDACRDRYVYEHPEIQLRGTGGYKGLYSSYHYRDRIIRRLIKAWKYDFDEQAWDVLKAYILEDRVRLERFFDAQEFDAITAIPLHQQRFCERGFDQAEEVGKFLAKTFNVPYISGLERCKATGRQSERGSKERKHILAQHPFRIQKIPKEMHRILLVDDVWTTGSTAIAAANCLAKEGKEVWVYTLARG